ncbi:MAG: hypothetical protein HZA69_05465 [Gammaproteobacteria bacterium]|nr:hypothetical protein [Gammaproteobacteria bacterium]
MVAVTKSTIVDRYGWLVIITATTVVLGITACGTSGLARSADSVVGAGTTIDDLKKLYSDDPRVWEKPSYYLTRNGNAVYVEPNYSHPPRKKKFYMNCDYHWEVNPQGRVVGYLTVGPKCTWYRGRNDTDPRLTEGATTQQQPR